MSRKLYCVTYTIEAYVLADDELEAVDLGEAAVGDVDLFECAEAEEVGAESRRARGWEDHSLVYEAKGSPKGGVKLIDAWPKKNNEAAPLSEGE